MWFCPEGYRECGFVRKNTENGVLCCFVWKDTGNVVYVVLFGRIPGMWFCPENTENGVLCGFVRNDRLTGVLIWFLLVSPRKCWGWVVITIAVS